MRQEVSIISAGSGFSPEMMDFMTFLNGRNEVLDDAWTIENNVEKRRERSGSIKQGLENPPCDG